MYMYVGTEDAERVLCTGFSTLGLERYLYHCIYHNAVDTFSSALVRGSE